jgi:hypothetical protein
MGRASQRRRLAAPPRSAAAADIFDAPEPNTKIKRAADRFIAHNLLSRIFRNIARELGVAEARDIFSEVTREVIKSTSKIKREETENLKLLTVYELKGRPPVPEFVRWLVKVNQADPWLMFGTPRGGYSAPSLSKQMRRLLKKKPNYR